MIKEHDRVVLTSELPEEALKAGDVGGEAFEVEFVTLDGETVAVETLAASRVRPVQRREITHARSLSGP